MARLSDLFVSVRADDSRAQRTLRNVRTSLSSLDKQKVEPKISLPERVAADIKGLDGQLQRLARQRVSLNVNSTTAKADVQTLELQLTALQRKRHDVPVNMTGDIDRSIAEVERELAAAKRRQTKIPLSLERVDAQFEAVHKQIRALESDPINLKVDVDQGGRFASRLGQSGAKAGKALGGGLLGAAAKFAGPLVVAFGAGQIIQGFAGIIQKAGEAEQSVGGVAAVFKGESQQIIDASAEAATAVGLDANAYRNLATTIGASLKNKGVDDFVGQTQNLIKLGADLASQFGGSTQEAVDALSSALRGEADPIERYGVNLNEAAIQAEALRLGLVKGNGPLTANQKAMATLSAITKQTADAQGNFARETDTFAHKQQVAAAAWEDLQVSIGEKFLPIASKAMGYIADAGIPTFKAFADIISATVGPIGEAGGSFSKFIDYLNRHQADVINTFRRAGGAVFDFGIAVAEVVAAALRQFGDFSVRATASVMGMIGSLIKGFDSIPFVDLSDSVEQFDKMKDAANLAAEGARDDLYGVADAIDKKVVPGIEGMKKRFDESARKEIITAKQRDALARTSAAIEKIGTKSDGSQIKLKKFSDITKLSDETQDGLRKRIDDAKKALDKQLDSVREAKGGQDKLTEAWKTGKKRLYDEFLQMGLSKKEAQKLAEKYAGVKPKVETKFETPGLENARKNTKDLDDKINNLNDKKVAINIAVAASRSKLARTVTFNADRHENRATGGVLPGYTPGRDVHDFYSPTAGHLHLSGGEAIMRPEWTKAVGGARAVDRMNAQAREGRFAAGGVFRTAKVEANIADRVPFAVDKLGSAAATWAGKAGKAWALKASAVWVKQQNEAAAMGGYGTAAAGKYGNNGVRFGTEQLRNASIIASVGSSMGQRAVKIALMTAMQESGLRNLSGGDRDSVGLFQQRGPWGPFSARHSPRAAASMFFHGGRGGQRGLDDIPGWQNRPLGAAAQAVQVSAFPAAYGKWADEASDIMAAMGRSGAVGGAGTGSRRHVTWKGGTFTERFRNTLIEAQRRAGVPIRVMQGGFSRRVRASGASHYGDAIDAAWNSRVLAGLRQAGVAAWHRTPAQGFPHHIHGVPLPGYGYAGGSGVWQAQDYKRGGNGLAEGGLVKGGRGGVTAQIGEGRFDELVLPLPKGWQQGKGNDKMDRLIALIEDRGLNAPTINVTAHNPIAEATSVTTNKILQKSANLGWV